MGPFKPGGTPMSKYNLVGSNFPPIYRGIPTDQPTTGSPSVPELNNVIMAAVAPIIYIGKRIRDRRKRHH